MADKLSWKDMEVGNIVKEAGSASFRKTGDWRTERPILDKEKCIKCALCWIYVTGGRKGPYWIRKSASNAPCAGFIALMPPLSPVRMDITRLTFTTAKDVVFVPVYAPWEL
jgi:hypothetical protein